jgi:thiamine kinase-like enzyme
MRKGNLDKRILDAGIKQLVAAELIDKNKQDLRVIPINAGTVNFNFRIENDDRIVLFKVFEKNEILPIDRKTIFSIQAKLSLVGLAAEPLLLSQDERFYCEAWVESSDTLHSKKRALTKQKGLHNQDEVINSLLPDLAEALYNVHNSHVGAPIIDLSAHLKTYWANVKEVDASLSKQFEEMLGFCDSYVEQNRGDFVLCHNDLHMDHVCVNSDIIFDWEYASYGCKYYDIASCSLINSLTEEQMEILCSAYAHLADQDSQHVIRSVRKVLKLTAFTFKLWHLCMDSK